jgi:rhodanese-related sulfurtransferase
MFDPHRPDPSSGEGRALPGALLILVAGIALGLAFNALGLASRPPHGLPWVVKPEVLQSVEALAPAPAGTDSAPASAPPVASLTASREHPAAVSAPPAAKPSRETATPSRHEPPAKPAPVTTAPSNQAATPAPVTATPTPPAAPPAPTAPVIPDVTGPLKVEVATFKRLYDADGALIVDAREADEYAEGHIAGAISLPYNDAMAEPDKAKRLDPGGRPIVVYCSGGSCELSMDLAKVLVESGKRRVLVYEGGFPEWQSAGYPVATGTAPGSRK